MKGLEMKAALVQSGLVAPEEVVGCSEEELRDIIAKAGGFLPSTYVDFLSVMGKSCGKFLQGTDTFFRHIPKLQSFADELLAENESSFVLPDGAFVFYVHQGYEFGYFLLDGVDDPKVFQFVEGDEASKLTWPSLSGYFSELINAFLNAAKNLD